MGLFGTTSPLDKKFDAMLEQLGELKAEVVALKHERASISKARALEDNVVKLREELETLKIEKGRVEETNAKERREVEHMVGLERKRGEFEIEKAKTEAVLDARQESLESARARFDEQMAFTEKRFDQQFASLNKLMGKFLERMPTTRQLISVNSKNGGGDGGDNTDE